MESNQNEIKNLLDEIKTIKNAFSGYEINHITDSMDDIKLKVSDLKQDLSDIKKEILNPENGLIVKINKIQDKLAYLEKDKIVKMEKAIESLELASENYNRISGFKDNVVKFLWIFFGGLLTLLIQLFSSK
jgi:chromosome segregation ATPase